MERKKTFMIGTCFLSGPSFLVFLWALSGIICKKDPLYLFGQVGASVNCYLLAISLGFGLALLLFLAILKKEKRFAFLSVPVLIFSLFLFLEGSMINEDEKDYELHFSSFSHSLVICNSQFLFSGKSVIYEKRVPFRLHYLVDVWGDDGAMPLEKREFYEVKEYMNGIVFTYHDNDWEGHVYLAYDGANFTLTGSSEDFK